jgi:restriction system protein
MTPMPSPQTRPHGGIAGNGALPCGNSNADETALLAEDDAEAPVWRDVLLSRLHRLTRNGFEEFAIYLLKTFGMELTASAAAGDKAIDGICLAPSPVLSTRVAVQARRYDPGRAIGREVVALFQRHASTAGGERAILVTLGRFTAAACKAAIVSRPTVDLIDG